MPIRFLCYCAPSMPRDGRGGSKALDGVAVRSGDRSPLRRNHCDRSRGGAPTGPSYRIRPTPQRGGAVAQMGQRCGCFRLQSRCKQFAVGAATVRGHVHSSRERVEGVARIGRYSSWTTNRWQSLEALASREAKRRERLRHSAIEWRLQAMRSRLSRCDPLGALPDALVAQDYRL